MEGFMEVELMVTKRDDNRRPTTDDDRVNIEQSASGRWTGRVLQKSFSEVKQQIFQLIIGLTIFKG